MDGACSSLIGGGGDTVENKPTVPDQALKRTKSFHLAQEH